MVLSFRTPASVCRELLKTRSESLHVQDAFYKNARPELERICDV